MTDVKQTTQQLTNILDQIVKNKNDPLQVERDVQEAKRQLEQFKQTMQQGGQSK